MKYALGTIIGTALLGLTKAKRGGRNWYEPNNIEDIYKLPKSKKAKVTALYFRNKNIKYLPDDIFDGFTNLDELSLQGNQLTKLPESIGNLTNLTQLVVSFNELTELPEAIGNLTNLKKLSLVTNQLTELPEWIGNLTNLENLSLNSNQLKKLPQSIGNLTNLKDLDLRGNQLTELPQSIGNLTNLMSLYLGWNSWNKPLEPKIIFKMISNRVHKDVIEEIINLNNSIPTKSNLRLR